MGDERFISSRENPRSFGFVQERLGRPPLDSISERFHAMLREREDELRGCGDETPNPPDVNEIMRMYGELLTELTFNSKPIITELTIIAGEQREHARGIAEAVCARIEEVPQDQKLPILYLLDSIVKNIGDDYVRTFATRLPKTFCQAYNDVHSSLHPAMRHLFQTWSQVFPHSTLSRIEEELKFSAPADQRLSGLASMRTSETSHSSHVIHVNPKYLEARRQFENDVTDIRHSREVSGHRSFTNYNDHDVDHLNFQPPNLRIVREGSSQSLTQHGSSMVGQEGPFLNSQRKVTTRISPARIGPRRSMSPQGQRFQMGSPGQAIEASSRSHSGLEFQSHRASDSNSWFGRSLAMDDGIQQSAALPIYNRYGRQRQRELIDAYGNYRDKDFLHESFPKVQRVDVNGMKDKTGKMDWQNSEEEEYMWEDMSPTLANSSKKSSTQFEPSTENLALRGNSSRPGIISEKSDFRRRSWPVPPPLKDSTTTTDERIAIRDYGFGPTNKLYLDDTGSTIKQFRNHESSHRFQDHGSLPHAFHHSTLDNLSPKSHGRSFQLPYLVSGVRPITHKRHSLYDNSHNAEAPFLKLPNALPNTPNLEMSTLATQKANQSLLAPSAWPPAHKSQPLQLLPTSNPQVDNNMPIGNQQSNFSVLLPQQPFDAGGRQLLRQAFQEPRGGFIPPVLAQPLSGVQPHGQSGVLDSILPNPIPGTSVQNMIDISLHRRSSLPPLPPGPPPLSSQPLTASQSNCSATSQSSVSGFSGLLSSLMAQGLISLTASAQSQNTVGLEFNAELLKIRHESAIKAMYNDLPRQCSTCGLRFTCQEDHSNHMDWHVTKNRISKNRKQKSSRKWFVSAKEWLCGAETLGADAVPGFLPTDAAPEQREETEMAVPADENQTVCALCGEPFEDFYSDETDEWMYRGAVYLNAPHGDIEGLERSQLGSIVHVKCRPESTEGSGQV